MVSRMRHADEGVVRRASRRTARTWRRTALAAMAWFMGGMGAGCGAHNPDSSTEGRTGPAVRRPAQTALAWKLDLPVRPAAWLLPLPVVAADGAVVVLDGDTLLRLDGTSGTVLGTSFLPARSVTQRTYERAAAGITAGAPAGPAAAASTPAVASDGSIWVGTGGGIVLHYRADGTLLAAEPVFPGSTAAPVLHVSDDGAVWAEGPHLAVRAPHQGHWTAVAVGEGTLEAIGAQGEAYFAPAVPLGASPSLVAYGEDGSIHWTAGMGALPSGSGIPLLANAVASPSGMVLLSYGSMFGRWFLVGITGGEVTWSVAIEPAGFDGGWARVEGVTDAGSVVVSFSSVMGATGGLQSYSAAGRLQWTAWFDAPHQVLAVARDGQVVAGLSGGGLVAFSGQGERLWERPSPAPQTRNPWGAALGSDGRVFISYGRTLYALMP